MAGGGSFTQDNRFLSLTTPMGKDVLLVNSFSVSERISTPYTLELDILFTGSLDPKSLLGQNVALSVSYGDLTGGQRYFHGIVNEAGVG